MRSSTPTFSPNGPGSPSPRHCLRTRRRRRPWPARRSADPPRPTWPGTSRPRPACGSSPATTPTPGRPRERAVTGVISGRSSAYPELYAALVKDPARQEQLDRVVALGASVGRIKHALRARGLAGTAARMTVDPPDPQVAAAIEAEVAALPQLPVLNTGRVNPRRGWRVISCRGPALAGRRASAELGRRKPSGRPGESGAPGLAWRERGAGARRYSAPADAVFGWPSGASPAQPSESFPAWPGLRRFGRRRHARSREKRWSRSLPDDSPNV